MLIDAHSLIYRAYFALIETPLTTSRGQLVNAAFGFWSIILRGFQDVKPDYVIACFDVGRSFRADMYSEYKATRRPTPDDLRDQFPIIRELLTAFRIPMYEMQGFEADDLIGALTRQAEEQGLASMIVSGDLDMLQLASENVSLMTTRMGVQSTVIYDPDRIRERYGLEPRQMIDFKALKGDTTDNIPGVPGVGDKTASAWLQAHGTLEGLYANLDSIKPERFRAKLAELKDDVYLWRDLVTIDRDAPIELDLSHARLGDYDRKEVFRLFREYEFRTLVERLPAVDGEDERAPGELLRQADRSAPVPAALVPGRVLAADRNKGDSPMGEGTGLQLSLDFGSLTRGQATASQTNGAAQVTEAGAGPEGAEPERAGPAGAEPAAAAGVPESAGTEPVSGDPAKDAVEAPAADARGPGAEPIARALPHDPRERLLAAIRDPDLVERFDEGSDLRGWLGGQPDLTVGVALSDPRPRRGELLGLAVAAPDGRVVAADANLANRLAFELLDTGRALAGHEVKPFLVWELARRDPEARADPRSLGEPLPPVAFDSQIAAYILNAALRSQSLTDICAERLSVELPPVGALRGPDHAAVQALAVTAARGSLEPDLSGHGFERLYRELELPLIPALATMEAAGVALDHAAIAELRETFSTEIDRLRGEIYADVGHEFTLGSPKQLEQVLFYELNLPRGRRTKTGFSTDAGVLEDLRAAHPMVSKLLDWRLYSKLKSTYVDALPALVDPLTDRVHTTFHQAVASTGRLSSTDPNLQNIPIRTELGRRIRRAFVAGSPDTVLVAADYSQIELRILAHVSGDVHLKEAFERHADIHRETAARVLHKPPQDVTPSERSMAKMVNFGLAYGMSDFGLSSRANIPRQEAQEFINSYFAAYSGIAYYMIHIKDLAKRQGYVETLLGRRRWIPELEARNPSLRSAGERMAINMPIQGTAADVMKIGLIRLHERLRREGSRARMLLSVHDEVLLEVPRGEVEALVPTIRAAMEDALPLSVPLTVDIKTGEDWESLTPMPDPALAGVG